MMHLGTLHKKGQKVDLIIEGRLLYFYPPMSDLVGLIKGQQFVLDNKWVCRYLGKKKRGFIFQNIYDQYEIIEDYVEYYDDYNDEDYNY